MASFFSRNSMKPNPEKGRRYITALDTARCNGNWQELPELARKIAKHAPERKCLIQTARAESQIAEHVEKTANSSDSSNVPSREDLLNLIPALLSATEEDWSTPQDIFQAQVCLGWLHWSLSEPALAVSRLPRDFEATYHTLSDNQELSPWTEICFIKGGYVKGAAQASASGADDALRTMTTVFRYAIEFTPVPGTQYFLWSEQFLAKCALLASDVGTTEEAPSAATVEFALWAFRAWASHGDINQVDPASSAGKNLADGLGSRFTMWMSYYRFLSVILQRRLPYSPPAEGPARVQLSSEFRRVETVCENIHLRNVKFPRAHGANHQIERWVEQVIQNWEVLCSHEWSNRDFGEGGQDAVSRNVLDILYRAATKTFHSTLILRHLFHVHATLAEFDLAIKAFDTYLDLVTTARNRAENSGKRLEKLEDDETFITTLSEGVIMLCSFGARKEAERTNRLTDRLEKELNSLKEDHDSNSQANDEDEPQKFFTSNGGKAVSTSAVSAAYQAMGIGLANWARWTPINESRTSIQDAAVTYLEKSLAIESDRRAASTTAFALGLLLAEMRDVNGAINQVRTALMPADMADDASDRSNAYSQDQELLPLWHLLALLLSARQEFDTALGVCEAALELAFSVNRHDATQRGHTVSAISPIWGTKSHHKEVVVELRLTQLALIEILHGPEAALNRSDELFSGFRQLFAGLGVTEAGEQPKQDHLAPPKTSAGTIRTFRSSIFRRNKNRQDTGQDGDTRSNGSTAPIRSVSSNADLRAASGAPGIEVKNDQLNVTTDNSAPATQLSPHKPPTRQASLTKSIKKRTQEPSSAMTSPARSQHRRENEGITGEGLSPTSGYGGSLTAKQALPPVAHNMKFKKEPLPAGHAKQPPQQDVRLPSSGSSDAPRRAITRFPKAQAQKHALGLLIKLWLFISGLYRRASLFDDAREACAEASEKASQFESLVAGQESSARAFADSGWGSGKSSDEHCANVCAEAGLTAEAISQPHEAIRHYEEALMYSPDHLRATVALANLLLNIYEKTLPAEEPQAESDAAISTLSLVPAAKPANPVAEDTETPSSSSPSKEGSPEELNRLAARDRAYGLLSALTKSGTGWDDAEAWLALSRAHEQGSQVEKAQEILWWCVELEDRRPIRHWWDVGIPGYVL